jgi:DNA-binding IclR family transcriptional regulator
MPIHVAAGAKVILSHSAPEFLVICLQQEFERFNDNTIVSKEQYHSLLGESRQTDIACDRRERYQDTHAMAVPIHYGGDSIPNARKPGPETGVVSLLLCRRLFFR